MKKLAFLTVLALFATSCHNDDTPVAPENPTSDLISPAMYMGIFTRDGNKPFTGVLSVAPCNESTSIYYGNYVNQKLTPFHGYYFIKDGSVYPNANNQEVSLPAGTYDMIYWGTPQYTEPIYAYPNVREPKNPTTASVKTLPNKTSACLPFPMTRPIIPLSTSCMPAAR